jgi:hypothetical protein
MRFIEPETDSAIISATKSKSGISVIRSAPKGEQSITGLISVLPAALITTATPH